MCGRYTFFTDRELKEIDDILEQIDDETARGQIRSGDIRPTDKAPVLLERQGVVRPEVMSWGLPNPWGKGWIINARSESAHEKKTFREDLRHRRCIILATGFYEWDSRKRKFLFQDPASPLLYLAGIYHHEEESGNRFVILTRKALGEAAEVHDRMPVMMPCDRAREWILGAGQTLQSLPSQETKVVATLCG